MFPKNYLLTTFGLEKRQINQVANFTYLEYPDNVDISDDPPQIYFKDIQQTQYAGNPQALAAMMHDHCLPEKFYGMQYEDFLQTRRGLMAKVIRETFENL